MSLFKRKPTAPAADPAPRTQARGPIDFIPGSGACLVSKNVLSGAGRVRWLVREESKAPADNGWIVFSDADDEQFTADMANNFAITIFNELCAIEPAVIGIYDFPVGSDLELVRTPEGPMFFVDATTGQRIPDEQLFVPPRDRA